MANSSKPEPLDFAEPIDVALIPPGGLLVGRFGDDAVLLSRSGGTITALGANCTHLGAPLSDGLVVDDTIRCPWHHACFSLKTGEATRAPAFDPLPRWTVQRAGNTVRVTGKAEGPQQVRRTEDHSLPGIVIVGGGAAGYAAAFELRRLGHEGSITMVSSDLHEPYDRTLLTKDYLDGKFGDDRLPIARTTLADLGVTFLGGRTVDRIARSDKLIHCTDDRSLPYTTLLLATGAEPRRLSCQGAALPHVTVLRSLNDCRDLVARLVPGVRVVVIGSSFIGLEAAASIRSRDIDVTVVTPDVAPMSGVLGPDLARRILDTHQSKGVAFHLGVDVVQITGTTVDLSDGTKVPGDLVILGIGVTPRTSLAEQAGLVCDHGIVVDAQLRTNDAAIYAVGDAARWPDSVTGALLRIEHWVVAERQGAVAACNMLGGAKAFDAVPFFWSKHFDFSVRYIGHAEKWDEIRVEGSLDRRDAAIRYFDNNSEYASATVGRDLEALTIERSMENQRNT